MHVEIRINGRMEFRISKPAGPVQTAAMAAMQTAIEKGQPIKVESIAADPDDVIVLSVEA